MVARGGDTGASPLVAILVVRAEVDVVEFDMILDVGSHGLVMVSADVKGVYDGAHVNVEWSKIPAELLLSLKADILEVLTPEDNDATLSDEQRQLIFLEAIQLRQLEATDLSADDGREFGRLDRGIVLWEEVRLLLVGDQPAVVELEWLEGRELCLFIIDREVR